jgi:acyl-CoA thioester hydrolase
MFRFQLTFSRLNRPTNLFFMAGIFEYLHRVSYAECTLGNHIYYSRYLDLLEKARGEFFRHLGKTFLQWQTEGLIFPVIECHLRYCSPARYDDVLTTALTVESAKGVRISFHYSLSKAPDQLVLEARTHHVCTGLDEKPKRLPEELIGALANYTKIGVK